MHVRLNITYQYSNYMYIAIYMNLLFFTHTDYANELSLLCLNEEDVIVLYII